MANIYHAPYRITQNFGPTLFDVEPAYGVYAHFHRGWDMVGPSNTCPIYAAVPGTVYSCGTDTDGAIYVIELADTGHYLCYWHLSKISCSKGQRVDNSTQIGNQGNSGRSTGFHAHVEVEAPGVWRGLLSMTPINPTPFLADPGGGSDVTPQDHAKYEIQDIADVIGGDPFYDQSQPEAFAAHVSRILTSKQANESRYLMRDFLRDYGWQSADQVKVTKEALAAAAKDAESAHQYALNLQTELDKAHEALKEAQKPEPTQNQVNCQQQVDSAVKQAVSAAEADADADPFPHLAAWVGNIFRRKEVK